MNRRSRTTNSLGISTELQDRCPRRQNESSIGSNRLCFLNAPIVRRTDLEHVRSLFSFPFSLFVTFLFSLPFSFLLFNPAPSMVIKRGLHLLPRYRSSFFMMFYRYDIMDHSVVVVSPMKMEISHRAGRYV